MLNKTLCSGRAAALKRRAHGLHWLQRLGRISSWAGQMTGCLKAGTCPGCCGARRAAALAAAIKVAEYLVCVCLQDVQNKTCALVKTGVLLESLGHMKVYHLTVCFPIDEFQNPQARCRPSSLRVFIPTCST